MPSASSTIDVARLVAGSVPTPDALMVALIESRRRIEEQLTRLHDSIKPLLGRLEAHLLSSDYLQGEETRMQVLREPGTAATSTKYMWVMRGGPPGRVAVMFNHDKTRAGAVVERLLAGFLGRFFQSDGY